MVNFSAWSLSLKIVACVFHSLAIACTAFRLMYRWYLAHFWWEDGLAAFALCADIFLLVATWLTQPTSLTVTPPINRITNWIIALGFVCVLWACRLSILFSIVRVANPSQPLRRIASAFGCSFVIMWIALLIQKIYICADERCKVAGQVGLSQLITDIFSDLVLVVLPIYFLRRTKINYKQRITIFSVFSASMLISAVTILHSIALFTVQSNGIVVIGHVKVALSLIVCNLLVIVAFIYRISRRGKGNDLEDSKDEIPFTTVDLNTGLTESAANKHTMVSQMSTNTNPESYFSTTKSSVIDEKSEMNMGSRLVH